MPKQETVLTHLIFDHHEIVQAEGAWVESTLCSVEVMGSFEAKQQRIVRRALGAALQEQSVARLCLTAQEAGILRKPELDMSGLLPKRA